MMEAVDRRNHMPRFIVESKQGETIEVPENSAGVFLTGCIDCTVSATGKNCNMTMERCEGMTVSLGYVVASIEIIHSTGIDLSALRCRTITVDTSKNVKLSCKCQSSSKKQTEETEVNPNTVANEASEIRLFTSSSEDVVINYEGIVALKDESGSRGAVTYEVPKDFIYEEGDGPRSVSRITVDVSGDGEGKCKTLRCDQYGIPLEQIEAVTAGLMWSWEHGKGASKNRPYHLQKVEEDC